MTGANQYGIGKSSGEVDLVAPVNGAWAFWVNGVKVGAFSSGGLQQLVPPAASDSSNTADTTANSQNRLSHVANNAALAAWTNTAFPVERDGFAAPGDGGKARYNYSANACGAGGNPAADGGTCINATATGLTGSWLVDWSSVRFEATPQMFGALFQGTSSSAADTAATQKAINTGKTVHIFLNGGTFYPSTGFTTPTTGQLIYGDGREYNGTGGTNLTISTATYTNGTARGVFDLNGAEPGPKIRDLSITFVQPADSAQTSLSALNTYQPCFYAPVPRSRIQHVGCYEANPTALDLRGNSGGIVVEDLEVSAYQYSIRIDGAFDTVRLKV